MRDELLNETLFFSLDAARQHLAGWVAGYNHRRPHSAIGYQTPAAHAARLTAPGGWLRETEALPSRPLLRQRKCAKTKRRLRFQLDDRRGSEQPEGSQDSVIRRKFQIQAPTVRGRSELNARGGS